MGKPDCDCDCDFYYFKPGGKWKYHGEGVFPRGPSDGGYYDVDHDAIRAANNGMPGIISHGKDMTVVVIPRDHCTALFGYPRMIKATEID